MADQLNRIIIKLEEEGHKEVATALRGYGQALKGAKTGTTATVQELKRLNKGSAVITYRLKKLKNGTVEVSQGFSTTVTDMRRFRMEWLSILFFTMNAQRQIQRVMSQSVTTFMKIAGETNRTNQTLAAFGAQINFIKFTLGRAIGEVFEPLLPAFSKIVEATADFIEQHPDTVVWGLVGAWGAFKALNILAQLSLVADAFLNITDRIGEATTALETFKTAAMIGAGIVITWLGIEFIRKGIEQEKWWMELLGILMTTFGGALIGWKIGALIGGIGGPTGAVIGAFIGLSIGLIIHWFFRKGKPIPVEEQMQAWKEQQKLLELEGKWTPSIMPEVSEETRNIKVNLKEVSDAISNTKSEWVSLGKTIKETNNQTIYNLTLLTDHYLGLEKKSSPLGWLLKQIAGEWENMGKIAIIQIRAILTELNKIPRTIVTTHYIRTVRTGVRGFQTGTQYVPRTGLYMLHQGERVVPQNQVTMGNINVTAHTNANPQEIAQMISRILNDELRRYI